MIRISAWAAFFLIVLRLCIGWHFAYEGYGKVKSACLGKSAVNEKPFSSETYFRESEGPFGKIIKSRIGDPDQQVVDKLTLKPVEGDASNADPKSRFPAALDKEWDDYLNRFVEQYKIDDEKKTKAQVAVDQAKTDFVKWVGKIRTEHEKEVDRNPPEKDADADAAKTPKAPWTLLKVKRKAPGAGNTSADFEEEVTVAERAAELKKKSDDVKAAYIKLHEMGKDVEGASLRTLKTDVAAIRTELQKELDDQTKIMKDGLARLLDTRVTAYAAQADNKDASATLQAMLTPMTGPEAHNPLARMWDEYAEYVKDFAPNMNDGKKAEVEKALVEAKARFDRWLSDQDMFTGEPLTTKDVENWRKAYAGVLARKNTSDAIKLETEAQKKALESQMQAELKAQSDALRAQAGTSLLGEDRAKGYAPSKSDDRWLWVFPKSWTLIDYIDWSTRWFLLVVGCMLLIGLFTRLSCFSAVIFLLLTVLTQPSLPWIPAAPNNEGNYLVINKNVIEMVALLALMCTRSGRWFGVDALIHSVFGRRNRDGEF
ncbi:MAG TPA: DoxX family protein [Gemmataceae bacterium]|jgi:uncharacterized membrane protein YphA (DoxX/SURF4 family)|nr:DoxX family protein [Gemmataceae bacterium]